MTIKRIFPLLVLVIGAVWYFLLREGSGDDYGYGADAGYDGDDGDDVLKERESDG